MVMPVKRPSWDEFYLGIAAAASVRADCVRRKVGALLVTRQNWSAFTGYNGSPPGQPGCLSDGACPRAFSDVPMGSSYDTGPGRCVALHAEQNIIIRAAGQDLLGGALYVTEAPCDGCRRMIEGSGIVRVVWPGGEWLPGLQTAPVSVDSIGEDFGKVTAIG